MKLRQVVSPSPIGSMTTYWPLDMAVGGAGAGTALESRNPRWCGRN